MPTSEFDQALAELLSFLDEPLTQTITQLEHALAGCEPEDIAEIIGKHRISTQLLSAALFVRERLDRITTATHAAAIALALPEILEPGEALHRPSLGAGNDPTRPFDVETDRRVAEFKLARWRGAARTQCVNGSCSKTWCTWPLSLRTARGISLSLARNQSTSS